MENKGTKSETKGTRNKIILKNLTKRQKEIISSTGIITGGVGLGTGLFTLYAMKEPENIPGISPDIEFNTIDNNEGQNNHSIEIISKTPITEIHDHNISFGEAFRTARNINGPGGWFIWKGNVYNTFYKEEWQDLSQNEKDKYLASIDIQAVPKQTEIENSITDPHILNAEVSNESMQPGETIIKDKDLSPDNEGEISIDFSNLYGYKTQVFNDDSVSFINHEPDSRDGEIILGEFITLDDDLDISNQNFFELPEDIEITTISENESEQLDSTIFDASEITNFPWETNSTSEEPGFDQSEQEINIVNLEENANTHVESHDAKTVLDEYPWGEPIIKSQETGEIVQLNEVINHDVQNKIITDPNEIKEYPWGEPIETHIHSETQNESESTKNEIDVIIQETHSHSSHNNVEEFPWGEKNENFDPILEQGLLSNAEIIIPENEDVNVGIILPENSENEIIDQLPPSFNDITEFPWGESVPNSMTSHLNSTCDDFLDDFSHQHKSMTDGLE